MAPSVRELIVSRLEAEAREVAALAEMVRDGDIKTPRELREHYLPHRLRALERVTHVFPKSPLPSHSRDEGRQDG